MTHSDSMVRTSVCIPALGWPQRWFSAPVRVAAQSFGWTVSNRDGFNQKH